MHILSPSTPARHTRFFRARSILAGCFAAAALFGGFGEALAQAGFNLARAGATFTAGTLSPDAHRMLAWVRHHGDNQGKPFVIVDKKQAWVRVYDKKGALLGASPALLGMATGDHDAPGAGLDVANLPAHQRITPAGRFASEGGNNLHGEDVIWFDYNAGLAIHRVRPGASYEQRLRSLASATAGDNRVSLGCVVVPVAFYETVVKPTLEANRGVVYVLPETHDLRGMIDALQL
jgi:hypothetical protein